ncbi:MAG TPA: DUF169 domain-containing protein [Bacteroidales bacterium]|nr:DUF169 domain-containing protein [Bacteroidales bacterium]HPS17071.1 DUF169 domain-containing protein [Bacteroidales bacterium]
MKPELKEKFITLWKKYFGNAELPITFFYSDNDAGAEWAEKPKGRSCLICELAKVRNGKSLVYQADAIACGGAKRYLGFTDKMRPGFEYFLSCGNANMEGERYIHTPEMVLELMKNQSKLPIEGKNIVFKRWDNISETDEPDVVIFFAKPDVLSGLFTLANFDQVDPNGTITPFGAGCGSIVYYPFLESKTERQRAVIGMFDPSARPCVPENVLSFAIPMKRFEKIIAYMEESFLITETWTTVKNRIEKNNF